MAALALHELIYSQGLNSSFTSSQILTQLKSISFDGLTGPVRLDPTTQDRAAIGFTLVNLQPLTAAEEDAAVSPWLAVGDYAQGVYKSRAGSATVRFKDGTSNVPRDRDPLPPAPPAPAPFSGTLSNNAQAALLGVSGVALGLIGLLALSLAWFRRTRVMHAASPTMLALVLLGGALVTISALLGAFAQQPVLCASRVWLLNIGFTTAFGSLLLKVSEGRRG
jgi:hypothetical protein